MKSLSLACLAALVSPAGAAAQSASDDFDRANSSSLGPDWIVVDGAFAIESNQGKKNNPFSFGFAHHASLVADYALTYQRVDFGPGGGNISLIAGLDPSTWSAIEVRLQDNDGDGAYDRLFFNAAVNAGNWNGSTLWYDLAGPTATGTMELSFTDSGDTAVVNITAPGGSTETFLGSGILSFPFPPTGNKFAIGGFGNGYFDNWYGEVRPYTILNLVGGQTATMQISGQTPGDQVLFAYSRTGAGPTWTPYGFVDMSLPIRQVGGSIVGNDGVASLDVAVPVLATGVTIYSQALNLTDVELSNSIVMTVQ